VIEKNPNMFHDGVFDENGNLLASVTPRSGLLSDLLQVTNAGNGEVAAATDENMLVVYKGSPVTAARALSLNGALLSLLTTIGDGGTVVGNNEYSTYTIPAWFSYHDKIDGALKIELSLAFEIVGLTALSTQTFDLEWYDGLVWVSLSSINGAADSSGSLVFNSLLTGTLSGANLDALKKLRLLHNNGGAAGGFRLSVLTSLKANMTF